MDSTKPTGAATLKGRVVPAQDLVYFKGCLLTAAELSEVERFSGEILPMDRLPRVWAPDTLASTVEYRRHIYGPYDPCDDSAGACARDDSDPLSTFRYASHRDQTKLCASALEAVTRALRRFPALKYVLYAGAAPGEHLAFIAEAFPKLEIYVYGPADCRGAAARPNAARQIHVMPTLFTDELARQWRARAAAAVFICGGGHTRDGSEAWRGMQMQLGWWQIMNPAAALFEFRLPCADGAASGVYPFLDGEILSQPFGPNTSAEGRLLVWAGAKMRDYDALSCENFFFWLNSIVREWASYDTGFDLALVGGLCRCFDCARLVQIFREYARDNPMPVGAFSGEDEYVAYLIERMVEATGQRLRRAPHGVRAAEPTAPARLALAAKYSSACVGYCRGRIVRHGALPH